MTKEITFDLSPRQTKAWDLLTNDQDVDLCYGGAKGGGKSTLFCYWVYFWTRWLIDFWQLKKSDHPLPVGFIGRKQSTDFTTTTLETWKRFIPSSLYEIRQHQQKEIIIDGRAKITFGGLDKQESINKFNSAEYAFIAVDQAEECDNEDISVLEGSLRLTYNGKRPPYKVLYTANPRSGFLKEEFVKGLRKGAYFIQALPRDNPFLEPDYEDRLRKAFGYSPELLKAYLDGDWDVFIGKYFQTFRVQTHVYDPNDIELLKSWPRFRSIDWGFNDPMCCLWHAVAPDQRIYTYKEYYEREKIDSEAAKEILELSKNETIQYTVGDPNSFPVRIPHYKFGQSIAVPRHSVWADNGIKLIMAEDKRVQGWARVREFLANAPDGKPRWMISSECKNLIHQLNNAQMDKNNPEDVSSLSEDHAIDAARYGLMSRPPINRIEHADQDWFRNQERMKRYSRTDKSSVVS